MDNSFSNRCLEALSLVPEGKVTTYKEIANYLGSKAYRAVGSAMNKNPNAPTVPCHRVVNSNGSAGGYAFGIEAKTAILAKEGVKIENNYIRNFEQHLYRFPRGLAGN